LEGGDLEIGPAAFVDDDLSATFPNPLQNFECVLIITKMGVVAASGQILDAN
jgi:hypothetical protein